MFILDQIIKELIEKPRELWTFSDNIVFFIYVGIVIFLSWVVFVGCYHVFKRIRKIIRKKKGDKHDV